MTDLTFWDDNATPAGVFNVGDMYDEYTDRQAAFIVEQLGDADGPLIDLGCGIGRLSRPIAEAIPDALVFGMDPSSAMRVKARTSFDPVYAYMSSLRLWRPDSVGGAWCVLTFQHLPDDTVKQHLADLYSILKPGARLVTQWVTSGEDAPMSYPRPWQQIHDLHSDAGFELTWWAGDHMVTGYALDWLWVTAEKPA